MYEETCFKKKYGDRLSTAALKSVSLSPQRHYTGARGQRHDPLHTTAVIDKQLSLFFLNATVQISSPVKLKQAKWQIKYLRFDDLQGGFDTQELDLWSS